MGSVLRGPVPAPSLVYGQAERPQYACTHGDYSTAGWLHFPGWPKVRGSLEIRKTWMEGLGVQGKEWGPFPGKASQ